MQSFKNFLIEGRDAPLFHGTDEYGARDILKRNIIQARTSHVHDLLLNVKTKHMKTSYHDDMKNTVTGVSLSRSFDIARKFGHVVFELDQAKLIQNYKIKPVQYFATSSTMAGARTTKGSVLTGHGSGKNTEAEEFVLGSIKNLDKYLIAVHIPDTGVVDDVYIKYHEKVKTYPVR